MQVQNVTLSTQNYNKAPSFKSVIPVCLWSVSGDNTRLVTFPKLVHSCQRLLSSALLGQNYRVGKAPSSKRRAMMQYLGSMDEDYKSIPYVRSYYNNNGGIRNINGVRSMIPITYLVTGDDAIKFEEMYGKPIASIKNIDEYSQQEIDDLKERAKATSVIKGPTFINERAGKLVDATGAPMELHATFNFPAGSHHLELQELKFYSKGAENNPLTRMGLKNID